MLSLPLSSVAVFSKNGTAHCPQAVRHCIAVVPLPTACKRCGSAWEDSRSLGSGRLLGRTPRPPSRLARVSQELHCSLPPSNKVVYCRICTAHCPKVVWRCIAGVPLLTQQPPLGHHSPFPQLVGPRIARVPLPTTPKQ